MRTVTYSDKEKQIITSGIAAVRDVLLGNDMEGKERLLFCLDYFLDSYYKMKLPYEDEIMELLQMVIISPNPLTVKEDALNLLTDYAYPPFPVLERNLEQIEDTLKPNVLYALNMGNEQSIIHALLNKCQHMFLELTEASRNLDASRYGLIPETAIIKYCGNGGVDLSRCIASTELTWKLGPGELVVIDNQIIHRTQPVSGMYYKEAAFWFHCDREQRIAHLMYQLGSRFGRCFRYDVKEVEQRRVYLVNEEVIWVS